MKKGLWSLPFVAVMVIVSCQSPVYQNPPSVSSNKVRFDANGGSGDMPDLTITANDSANLPANTFSRTGYSFTGWNTSADNSGTAYAAGATFTMGAVELTLFAQWTALSSHDVSYDGNDNSGGTVPAGGSYLSGAAVTVRGNTGGLVKTGTTFAGWNTLANGSGTDYAAGATLAMESAPVTLYAQWTSSTGNGLAIVDPPKTTVTLTGQSSFLAQNSSMKVSATASDTTDSCAWYLDGYLIQQGGMSCTVGPSLSLGAHGLVAMAGKGDTLFSASCLFTVQ
ncbi:MAG: InlB B-repeat-containing protein [Rectinemataceae bacterium]